MPLTILVVEDDPGTRLAISDYLQLSGYSVLAVKNGLEALSSIQQGRPHLIVTDVLMPQMDGYTLVEKVRINPDHRLLPVIFLTARSTKEERIRGYQLGCDAYLPKPFELDELGAVVRNLLERSQIVQTELLLRSHPAHDDLRSGATTPNPLNPDRQRPNLLDTPQLALTSREEEVLGLLTKGLSNNQIGDRLHLSPRTVEKYVSSLLRKTETVNRAELVRFALEHQMLE